MMPNGWSESQLGELFKKRSSSGLDDLPTVSVTLDRGLVLRENLDRKMDTTLEAHQHLLVKKGDIAYNMMRMWQGALGLAEFDCIVSPAYVVCEPRDTNVCSKFFYYLFKTPPLIKKFKNSSRGLTEDRLRLYYDDFERIKVRVPLLGDEQEKIAKILSAWDEAIEKLEPLIEQKKNYYLGLSQKLKSVAEENGDVVTFDDLFDIRIGGTPSRSKPEYWCDSSNKNGHSWVAISDLKQKYLESTSEKITNLGVEKSNVKLIPAGAVIMSFKLSIGRKAILRSDCYTNEAIAALVVKEPTKLLIEYLYHALNWVRLDAEIDVAIKGKTLNKDKLKRLALIVPPLEVQQSVAAALEAMDVEIALTAKQLNSIKLQKQGLMQQLLTGKKRVKV